VRELEQALAANPESYTKCTIADLLGIAAERSDAALGPLVSLVGDPDSHEAHYGCVELVADHAKSAVWRIGERAVPLLVGLLAQPGRRGAALDVLGALGTRARAALPAIEPFLRDPDPAIARAAGYAYGTALSDAPDIVARCKRLLDDPATRRAGMTATAPLYVREWAELVETFIALLADPDDRVRYLAANRVRMLGKRAAHAEDALTALLSDKYEDVRREAAEALRAVRTLI
jgi:HEAT repeat protein